METPIKTNGDPSIRSLATGLGTLGRYGDSYMVHAAEGETVVPREILEANPELRANLFSQMRMMGVGDPNRYVVGNSLNSINPVTGQPEFFFKKIWRAIKKVAKAVAPVVVPIIGNLIAPGIGGILASGLYTKATGGSWGDALKSAGTAWLGQGLSQGIAGMGEGGEGFMSGFKGGLKAPFSAGAGLFKGGAENTFNQGIFGAAGYTGLFPKYRTAADIAQGAPIGAPDVRGIQEVDDLALATGETTLGAQGAPDVRGIQEVDDLALATGETTLGAGVPEDRNILQRGADYLFRGGETPEAISAAQSDAGNQYIADMTARGIAPTEAGLRAAEAAAGPGMVARIAPSTAIVGGVAALIDSKSDEDILPSEGSERFAAYKDWQDLINAGGDKDSPQAQTLYHQWNQTPGDLGYTREAWARAVGVDVSNRADWQFAPAQGVGLPTPKPTTGESLLENTPAPVVSIPKPAIDQSWRAPLPMPETVITDDGGDSAGFYDYRNDPRAPRRYPQAPTPVEITPQLNVPGGIQTIYGGMPDQSWRAPLPMPGTVITDDGGDSAGFYDYRNDPRAPRRYPQAPTPVEITPQLNVPGGIGNEQYPRDRIENQTPRFNPDPTRLPPPGGQYFLDPEARARAEALKRYQTVGTGQRLAGGGEVYGRGTGTSDSIPARLSDGEFVMTAEAVRNAGGGDRQLGAARMYDMMRRFEGGAI